MKEEEIKEGDFIEIKFTGKSNGKIFDSNVQEDIEKTGSNQKSKESIVIVGERMVLPKLDKSFLKKKVGEKYEIHLEPEEGFGLRKREYVKVIPLKVFTLKNVNPKPGMVLTLDNSMVKIIAVSGARVTTDFNNPLAGKRLDYQIEIIRKVNDETEKIKTTLEMLFKFVPEFEKEDGRVIIKGPKGVESYVDSVNEKFKKLTGNELGFKELSEKINKQSVRSD